MKQQNSCAKVTKEICRNTGRRKQLNPSNIHCSMSTNFLQILVPLNGSTELPSWRQHVAPFDQAGRQKFLTSFSLNLLSIFSVATIKSLLRCFSLSNITSTCFTCTYENMQGVLSGKETKPSNRWTFHHQINRQENCATFRKGKGNLRLSKQARRPFVRRREILCAKTGCYL